MNPMKSRGRSKFFACFKAPVVVDDGDCESPGGGGDGESSASGDDESGRRRKKSVRRRVCVVLKAVFLPPLRKCRSESYKQELYRLRSNLSSKSEKLVRSVKKINLPTHKVFRNADEIFRMNSICRLSLFSSDSNSSRRTTATMATVASSSASSTFSPSDSSSFSSHSRSISSSTMTEPETIIMKRSASLDLRHMRRMNKLVQKKSTKRGKRNNDHKPTLEMCNLVVCLLALLLWGKVFAILTCTSTWLLFAPDRHCQRAEFSENDVVEKGGQEGLLERNRSRALDM